MVESLPTSSSRLTRLVLKISGRKGSSRCFEDVLGHASFTFPLLETFRYQACDARISQSVPRFLKRHGHIQVLSYLIKDHWFTKSSKIRPLSLAIDTLPELKHFHGQIVDAVCLFGAGARTIESVHIARSASSSPSMIDLDAFKRMHSLRKVAFHERWEFNLETLTALSRSSANLTDLECTFTAYAVDVCLYPTAWCERSDDSLTELKRDICNHSAEHSPPSAPFYNVPDPTVWYAFFPVWSSFQV